MSLSEEQKTEIEAVLQKILDMTVPVHKKRPRRLAEMFLILVDKKDWAEYYEVLV